MAVRKLTWKRSEAGHYDTDNYSITRFADDRWSLRYRNDRAVPPVEHLGQFDKLADAKAAAAKHARSVK